MRQRVSPWKQWTDSLTKLVRRLRRHRGVLWGRPRRTPISMKALIHLVEQVREYYASHGLPRHPKKSVEQALEAEVQGAWLDGRKGILLRGASKRPRMAPNGFTKRSKAFSKDTWGREAVFVQWAASLCQVRGDVPEEMDLCPVLTSGYWSASGWCPETSYWAWGRLSLVGNSWHVGVIAWLLCNLGT